MAAGAKAAPSAASLIEFMSRLPWAEDRSDAVDPGSTVDDIAFSPGPLTASSSGRGARAARSHHDILGHADHNGCGLPDGRAMTGTNIKKKLLLPAAMARAGWEVL